MTRVRVVWWATAAVMCVAVVAGAPASSGAPGNPEAAPAKPAKPPQKSAPAMLMLSVSVAPSSWLAGAQVTVTDRHGTSVQGVTNAVGHLSFPVGDVKRNEWPLRVVTNGGSVDGRAFGGHVRGFVWAAGTVSLNLWSTAASAIVASPGKNSPSAATWSKAFEKVRGALAITPTATPGVLEGGNFFVDRTRIDAEVAKLGGYSSNAYDKLADKIAAAATAKPQRRTSLALAPTPGSVIKAGPSLTDGVSDAGSTPCGAIQPDIPAAAGKSTGFWVTVGVGAVLGAAWNIFGGEALKSIGRTQAVTSNGYSDFLSGGYYAGTIFGWGQQTGQSAESAQLIAIHTQLTCISNQILAVQTAVTDLANSTKVYDILDEAGALDCASQRVSPGFLNYKGAVKAAVPQSVTLLGVSNDQLQVPQISGSNFSTVGTTVVGDGIPQVYLGGNTDDNGPIKTFATQNLVAAGSDQLQFSTTEFLGFNTAALRGQRVSGPGVGVNADNSAAQVVAVSNSQGVTTVTLSAPATAPISASTGMAFAAPNTVTNYSGGLVTLKVPPLASVGANSTVTVAQALDVTSPILAAPTSTSPNPATWNVGDCVNTIDKALFESNETYDGESAFSAYWNYVNPEGSSTATPAQVSQMQQFLQYWGLIEVQAFVLGSEYSNYLGNGLGTVQSLSGFSPVIAADGTPVCWDDTAVTYDVSGTACYALSHLASAWPDTLYSDEIGQIGSEADKMIAVNGFPGGLVVPAVTPWNLSRGATTLNPGAWLALYWQLGANLNCLPEVFSKASSGLLAHDPTLYSSLDYCESDSSMSTWSDVATNSTTISVTGKGLLPEWIADGAWSAVQEPSGTWLDRFPDISPSDGSSLKDPATDCPLGRPYLASAQCQFNSAGFNPAGYDSPTTQYPHGVATFAAGEPVISTSLPHNLSPGDPVQFWGNSSPPLPSPLQPDVTYTVLTTPTPASFEVATVAGGTAVTPGADCPGDCYFFSSAGKQSSTPNTIQNYLSPKAAHTLTVSTALLGSEATRIAQTGTLLAGMQCIGSIDTNPSASVTKASDSSALFSTTQPVTDGQALVFWSSVGASVSAGSVYYVINPTSSTTGPYTFQVSTTPGGPSQAYSVSSTNVTFNSTQCPRADQAQDVSLLEKTFNDAGFFAGDGSVNQYLWFSQNNNALCQNKVVFEYPQQYSYAYSNYTNTYLGTAGTTVQLPTGQSALAVSDLHTTIPAGKTCSDTSTSKPTVDPPHSCWGQGALSSGYYSTADGYGRSPWIVNSVNWDLQMCATPFSYNPNPGFRQDTDLNTANYDAKRFDSFVLARTWWPALPGLLSTGPPAPLTVECADDACTDYEFVTVSAPSGDYGAQFVSVSPTVNGTATVSWAQPISAGTGSISNYTVTATGWTCTVANADQTTGNATTTFATCTGGNGTPAVTVTATNTTGGAATATATSTFWEALLVTG